MADAGVGSGDYTAASVLSALGRTRPRVNFMASAIGGKYEAFLPPFIFFALTGTVNSVVEVMVANRDAFCRTYRAELEAVARVVGPRIVVRNHARALAGHIPNTYRFFEVPTVRAEYTYVADVDIMFLDDVLEEYLRHWPTSTPMFNNIIRPCGTRLTGVHMVRTDLYFTDALVRAQSAFYAKASRANDEVILLRMCKQAFGDAAMPVAHKWRGILGVHFSPNRGKGKEMGLKTSRRYAERFRRLLDEHKDLARFKCFSALRFMLDKLFVVA